MNSKELGADLVFAWPDAQIGVMGAEQAVGIIAPPRDRRRRRPEGRARAARPQLRRASTSTAVAAVADGHVDEIIAPATRARASPRRWAAWRPRPGPTRPAGNLPL